MLWKVSLTRDQLETETEKLFDDPLDPMATVSEIFDFHSVDSSKIQLVAKNKPDTGTRKRKRAETMDSDLLEGPIWRTAYANMKTLWGKGKDTDIYDPFNGIFRHLRESDAHGVDLGAIFSLACVSRALVRDEYKRIWKILDDDEDKYSMVILGQSGIGKSLFLYLTLLRRVFFGLPTAYQSIPGFIHIFDNHGGRTQAEVTTFQQDTLFLLDSSKSLLEPPPRLMGVVPRVRILQVISRDEKEGYKWTNVVGQPVRYMVMKLWRRKEVVAMAELFDFDQSRTKRALDVFDKWGPSAQLCYNLSFELSTDTYEDVVASEIGWLFSSIIMSSNVDFACSAFYICPKSNDPTTTNLSYSYRIPTSRLRFILASMLDEVFEDGRNKIINHLSLLRSSGSGAEPWIHNRLSGNGLVEFVKNDGTVAYSVAPNGKVSTLHDQHILSEDIRLPLYVRLVSSDFAMLTAVLLTDVAVYLIRHTLAGMDLSSLEGLGALQDLLPTSYSPKNTRWVFV